MITRADWRGADHAEKFLKRLVGSRMAEPNKTSSMFGLKKGN